MENLEVGIEKININKRDFNQLKRMLGDIKHCANLLLNATESAHAHCAEVEKENNIKKKIACLTE